MKRWYVFDQYDCFDAFATAEHAARIAEKMVEDGYEGVEIRCFTKGEFDAYCTSDAALQEFRKNQKLVAQD